MESKWRDTESDGLMVFSNVEPSSKELSKEDQKEGQTTAGLDLSEAKASQTFTQDSQEI